MRALATMGVTPVTDPYWRLARSERGSWRNERGNLVRDLTPRRISGTRYQFDEMLAWPGAKYTGWAQYDTDQDAEYFGVWVNVEKRMTLTYAEGDVTLVYCPTVESFRAEMKDAARFYGPPPPAFIVIDRDAKSITNVYDRRPA